MLGNQNLHITQVNNTDPGGGCIGEGGVGGGGRAIPFWRRGCPHARKVRSQLKHYGVQRFDSQEPKLTVTVQYIMQRGVFSYNSFLDSLLHYVVESHDFPLLYSAARLYSQLHFEVGGPTPTVCMYSGEFSKITNSSAEGKPKSENNLDCWWKKRRLKISWHCPWTAFPMLTYK